MESPVLWIFVLLYQFLTKNELRESKLCFAPIQVQIFKSPSKSHKSIPAKLPCAQRRSYTCPHPNRRIRMPVG